MAFANLLDPDTYARRDKRTLSDLLDAQLNRERDVAASNAATRGSDIHNDEGDLLLQQHKAMQPEAMREINTEVLPPPLAGAPQQNIPPNLAQQPQAAQDPYSAQQSLMDEKAQQLDWQKTHPALMASNSIISDMQKQKESNLAARTELSGGQLAIQKNREWGALKPQLDRIMQAPAGGWDPLKGTKGIALDKAISQIPAYLLDHPGVKQWIADKKSEQQNTVFNPAMSQMRDIPSLRTQSTAFAKTYQTAKDALNAAEAEYANYLKDPTSPTNRVDQQGIIDKYTMVSLGKSPTEAQIELAQQFPGIESWFDLASGRLKTGQIIPKAATDEMMRNMRGTVINYGSNLKQKNAVTAQAADLGGIDPRRVVAMPDEAITADSTRFANAPTSGPVPKQPPKAYTDPAKEARYQAWKKANGH